MVQEIENHPLSSYERLSHDITILVFASKWFIFSDASPRATIHLLAFSMIFVPVRRQAITLQVPTNPQALSKLQNLLCEEGIRIMRRRWWNVPGTHIRSLR
jgi:hypothetical protein